MCVCVCVCMCGGGYADVYGDVKYEYISAEGKHHPLTCILNTTLNYLMMRPYWYFRVLLHCHYLQFHSCSPVRVSSMGQIEVFKHLLWLKPFNCGQTKEYCLIELVAHSNSLGNGEAIVFNWGNVEYSFIAITSRFTPTRIKSTC